MKSSKTETHTETPTHGSSSKILWVLLGATFVIFLIIILFGAVLLIIGNVSPVIAEGNVALITIKGMIVTDDGFSFLSKDIASSTKIVEQIKKANEDTTIKAIIFEINSPGGSAIASDEIAAAIKSVNKTKVAWIREVGASGAYWVASSADVIVANRMSITGSIGVIASYLEFSGLTTKYNVTYQRLVAGKYKDIGSPFKPMTKEEEYYMQQRLQGIHKIFIEEVAKNRKLSVEQVQELANGLFYLGEEAKELGLVDILGGKEEAVKYVEGKLGIPVKLREFKEKKTLLDILAQTFSQPKIVVMAPGEGTNMIQV